MISKGRIPEKYGNIGVAREKLVLDKAEERNPE
jgi:hypothetical protein